MSGNVKVPAAAAAAAAAGTLNVECSRLEYTALNGPPALLQTHIYKLLRVTRDRTRGFYIHCNRDARITSSVTKWQENLWLANSKVGRIWKETALTKFSYISAFAYRN